MAKTAKSAWGIEVGNCALKAIKVAPTEEGIEVLDFAVIPHEKILSQPDMDPQQRRDLVERALTNFVQEHDLSGSPVVVSVPGQNSFARFIKLPPVESKRIPEIVRFEAMQQIPFDINDVEWDWQAFSSPDDPEVEVGIFAIKRDLVSRALEPFSAARVPVSAVQMAPMALYNFLRFEQRTKPGAHEATILLDIGAENTELVIADSKRVWQRSIPIGGNQFTLAVQKAFKLSFSKAEAIKRTANTSKYARQIFQAMRSVFADLAAEIQRSIGFYSSGNRNVQFRKVLAVGNAMRLPGLTKFLQQSLSLPIKRVDAFERVRLSSELSMAQFTENIGSMAVAYGLAIQGLNRGAIGSNLLPREIARQGMWRAKQRWFAAAAALFVVAGLLSVFQAASTRSKLSSGDIEGRLASIRSTQSMVQRRSSEADQARTQRESAIKKVEQIQEYYGERNVVPQIMAAIHGCVPDAENHPDQAAMYEAFAAGDREGVLAVPRENRKQVFIHQVQVRYTDDLRGNFEGLVDLSSLSLKGGEMRGGMGGGMGGMDMGGGMGGMGGMMGGMGGMMGGGFPPPATGMEDFGMPPGFGPPGMPGGGFGGPGGPGGFGGPQAGSGVAAEETAAAPGFVVVVRGTTPNKEKLAFLLAPNPGLDRSEWRFFNRLQYLGKTREQIEAEREGRKALEPARAEPNLPAGAVAEVEETATEVDLTGEEAADAYAESLPFETFLPGGDVQTHFDMSRQGWLTVEARADQLPPSFIGVLKPEREEAPGTLGTRMTGNRQYQLPVYVDPFTGEPITDTLQFDQNGTIIVVGGQPQVEHHDYWFEIRFKLALKNPPAGAAPASPAAADPYGPYGPGF